MRTGTPLWIALVACALTLGGCKMQLNPTTATKVWCCATCPGYTKPVVGVAFLDHRGDPIPLRRVYITGGGAALEYARDAEGAPLPKDGARNGWMYVISGQDGKATISFDLPPTFDNVPDLVGSQGFEFKTYLDEQPATKPLTSKELKVNIANSCQ